MGERLIRGLQHIQLAMPAGMEDRAREFYAEVLSLEPVEKPPHLAGRGGCWFRSEGVEVHLGVEAGFQPARKAHPAFLVGSLAEVRQRLEDAGMRIIEDTELADYDRFYSEDPFGSRLEFMQPKIGD